MLKMSNNTRYDSQILYKVFFPVLPIGFGYINVGISSSFIKKTVLLNRCYIKYNKALVY